jgi:arginine deiminase
VVYGHHPRFAGSKSLYGPWLEHVEGGDVLLLAPSVIAVGAGDQTTPAGVERLARRVFDAGLAHTVLAVPLAQCGRAVHLDTVCTMVDTDTVVMYPRIAFTLTAHTITPSYQGLRVSRPQPFLEAAAQAMGIDRLKVVETGLDPLTARGRQWDDGGNALAIDRKLAVCHERNVETNARLEAAGIRVIPVPGSELGSRRGGPRCMTCPVARDPATLSGPACRFRPGAARPPALRPEFRTGSTAAGARRSRTAGTGPGRPARRQPTASFWSSFSQGAFTKRGSVRYVRLPSGRQRPGTVRCGTWN